MPGTTVTHRFTSPGATRLGVGLIVASAAFGVIVVVLAQDAVPLVLGLLSAAGFIALAVHLLLTGLTGIAVAGGTLYAGGPFRRHRIPLDDVHSFRTTVTGPARDGLAVTARLKDGRLITFAEPVSRRSAAGHGETPVEKAVARLDELLAEHRRETP